MIQRSPDALTQLYEVDETAWLDEMVRLIDQGRRDELDYPHLSEFLSDMAKRDRREVNSRLTRLLAHVLKWVYQPAKRTKSWSTTILVQQDALQDILSSRVLRNHAESILQAMFPRAVKQAVAETGLAPNAFPGACPFTLDQLLQFDVLEPDDGEGTVP